jgi:hypothetical protein
VNQQSETESDIDCSPLHLQKLTSSKQDGLQICSFPMGSEWIDDDSFLPPHLELGTGPGQPLAPAPEDEQSREDQTHAGSRVSLACPLNSEAEQHGRHEQAEYSHGHIEGKLTGRRRYGDGGILLPRCALRVRFVS